MARPLVPEAVWERIEPLLPERPARPQGGRPPLGDREALTGIVFVLKTGLAWPDLPTEMGCGCGMTCLRRLREWQDANVWNAIERILKEDLDGVERIDWLRTRRRSGATARRARRDAAMKIDARHRVAERESDDLTCFASSSGSRTKGADEG